MFLWLWEETKFIREALASVEFGKEKEGEREKEREREKSAPVIYGFVGARALRRH